ncbi:MAG: class I SAM-dependent methyltransferase [Acidobacteriota bacterium]
MSQDFDEYAADYEALLRQSLGAAGGDLEFFRRRKAAAARRLLRHVPPRRILEYGCGTGGNLPHLAAAFPGASVAGGDISEKSLEQAAAAAPSAALYHLGRDALPTGSFDLVFVAGVLHHVPPPARGAVMAAMAAALAPGGRLLVFEHNPANPLTRRIVARCPFDAGVSLLPPAEALALAQGAGLGHTTRRYVSFVPPALAPLAPLEILLAWLPLGGQYCLLATKGS